MAELLLGPLLRYAGPTEATVWVKTDVPCTVEALGHTTRTFTVDGHHFALVGIEGLRPGAELTYEVALDGERCWPVDGDEWPAPVIRTPAPGAPLTIALGSCRVDRPHHAPYDLHCDEHPEAVEPDALRALALRMARGEEDRPDAVLLLGDQVYADEVSPEIRERIRARRDVTRPPGEEVADFEEYCWLYEEAWRDPAVRWLLSTVPSAMIFDDHDVHDDWNTSLSWRRRVQATTWWDDRIAGALMSYWCFQHLGNLAPEVLAADELYERVRGVDDGGPLLRDFALRADRTTDGSRWSFHRDFGGVRLVMIDSRAGRVLTPGERSMVDEDEWRWIEANATGDHEHLLLGTSLPWLLPAGMHGLEAWNEAVCEGAWGRPAARAGEWVRQALDLEHWAAFRLSFERLARLVSDVAAGRRGAAPAAIVALSGDVHNGYVAEAELHRQPGARSRVHQVVCSPLRNALSDRERRAVRFAESRAGARAGAALARAARVPEPPLRWRRVGGGPWFENQVATLRFEGRHARLRLEVSRPARPGLETVLERELA